MKESWSCAYCKPADMDCQISVECKRERRLKKLDKQINDNKVLSAVADKLIERGIIK